jgi:hypothetical protein
LAANTTDWVGYSMAATASSSPSFDVNGKDDTKRSQPTPVTLSFSSSASTTPKEPNKERKSRKTKAKEQETIQTASRAAENIRIGHEENMYYYSLAFPSLIFRVRDVDSDVSSHSKRMIVQQSDDHYSLTESKLTRSFPFHRYYSSNTNTSSSSSTPKTLGEAFCSILLSVESLREWPISLMEMVWDYLPDWLRLYVIAVSDSHKSAMLLSIRISTLYPVAIDTSWTVEPLPLPMPIELPSFVLNSPLIDMLISYYKDNILDVIMVSSSLDMMSQSAYVPNTRPSSSSSSLSLGRNEAYIVIRDRSNSYYRYSVHGHKWLPLSRVMNEYPWGSEMVGFQHPVIAAHDRYLYIHPSKRASDRKLLTSTSL